MKKILISLLLLLVLPGVMQAQDARQRTTETVLADCLAQLPAEESALFNTLMQELCATGSGGVESLAQLFTATDAMTNATVQYALSGMVAYASAAGREAQAAAIRQGLLAALAANRVPEQQNFLISLLGLCSTAKELPVLARYAQNPQLADAAVAALIQTPENGSTLLTLLREAPSPSARLAAAAGATRLTDAEPILLSWLKATTDAAVLKNCYDALSKCGTHQSLKTLAAAAKRVDYAYEPTDATGSYVALTCRLARSGDSSAIGEARKLMKNKRTHLRTAALSALFEAEPQARESLLWGALADEDRAYRVAALDAATAFATDELRGSLVARIAQMNTATQTDLIRWLGSQHARKQSDVVVAAIGSSDEQQALAAICAAGKIGGEQAATALFDQLSGKYAQAARTALAAFPDAIDQRLLAALDRDAQTQQNALVLVRMRRVSAASDRVYALCSSPDAAVQREALLALGSVSRSEDFDRLCSQLDGADASAVEPLQRGVSCALREKNETERYNQILRRMNGSQHAERYYPLLAEVGSRKAIESLLAADQKEVAFEALLRVENPEVSESLFTLAEQNPAWRDAALLRYTELVSQSRNSGVRKYELYRRALAMNPSTATQKKLLAALSATGTESALLLAVAYLDQPETALSAAGVVKTIAAKRSDLGGAEVADALTRAKAVYAAHAAADADAGYAVDEITGLLAKLPKEKPQPYQAALTEEEQAEGYRMLFDGQTLNGWTGNKTNYVPDAGTIYVTAQYGGGGNLYTEAEYSDFVLRFEFCFEREGVNNGIGIRTPMGVDAAYHGMEIQVLDHDAAIYKNLHEYQQHGSVYGIIPAHRVKFPALGSWNVEEIRAVGDRITVTVNGEVILDGNIREACQGHNEAPDGTKTNPYTVDHKNHPGLFNRSGHIGLLGHGAGLRYRNLRIKTL